MSSPELTASARPGPAPSFLAYGVHVQDDDSAADYELEALSKAHAAAQAAQLFLGLRSSPEERSRLTIQVRAATSKG